MAIVRPEFDKNSKKEDLVPVLVEGDVKIEDDIITDEEINAMTEDDKEVYNRYKSNAFKYLFSLQVKCSFSIQFKSLLK